MRSSLFYKDGELSDKGLSFAQEETHSPAQVSGCRKYGDQLRACLSLASF